MSDISGKRDVLPVNQAAPVPLPKCSCSSGLYWRHLLIALVALVTLRLASAQDIPNGQLQIKVLVPVPGEALPKHTAGEKVTSEVAVSVLSETELPVPNATVVFQAPPDGASVLFLDDASSITVSTDDKGIARVRVRANKVAGQVQPGITVTASFEGKKGTETINQTNERPPVITTKRVAIAGGVAAAIVIPILALRKTPPPTAGIEPGTGSVSGVTNKR